MFSVMKGQKIKYITKMEKKVLFTFLILLFMVFLMQRLIYTTNLRFKFVFGLFKTRSCIKLTSFQEFM